MKAHVEPESSLPVDVESLALAELALVVVSGGLDVAVIGGLDVAGFADVDCGGVLDSEAGSPLDASASPELLPSLATTAGPQPTLASKKNTVSGVTRTILLFAA